MTTKDNQSKYTPGPWEFTGRQSNYDKVTGRVQAEQTKTEICSLNGLDFPVPEAREQARANAHLIAAAPEMLETAENIIDDLERFCRTQGSGPDKRLEALKKAIAKAKGQLT